MAGMINKIDVSTTITASGSSDSFDSAGLGQISFTSEVTAISGSGAYIQFEIQVSNDGTNWNVHHDTHRFTATGFQTIPGVRISEKYYRYIWMVGGTSPSIAIKITTTLKDYSPSKTGSMFRYADLDLKTGNAVSTTYTAFSDSNISVISVRPTDTSTPAVLKIQGSNDGLNWDDNTGEFTLTSGQTLSKDFSGNSHRFLRLLVVTAATGGSTSVLNAFWTSTGGS